MIVTEVFGDTCRADTKTRLAPGQIIAFESYLAMLAAIFLTMASTSLRSLSFRFEE